MKTIDCRKIKKKTAYSESQYFVCAPFPTVLLVKIVTKDFATNANEAQSGTHKQKINASIVF